jgi:hypothetical protein
LGRVPESASARYQRDTDPQGPNSPVTTDRVYAMVDALMSSREWRIPG